jgi:hypothetical protein
VDQDRYALLSAGCDDVSGSDDIGAIKILPVSPYPGFCSRMENSIDTFTGLSHRVDFGHIAFDLFDSPVIELVMALSAKTSDVFSLGKQLPGDGLSQKAAASRDQNGIHPYPMS